MNSGTVSGGDAYSMDVSLTDYDSEFIVDDVDVENDATLIVIMDPS